MGPCGGVALTGRRSAITSSSLRQDIDRMRSGAKGHDAEDVKSECFAATIFTEEVLDIMIRDSSIPG